MIAVAGGKGGCGKTTTTACIARALADAGSDPIVVDVDLDMPDLHVVAGGRLEPGLDALAGGTSLAEVTQSTIELPGVRLVASGVATTNELGPALTRLRKVSDPVLLDTPAGASPAVAASLRAADATVVVSTPTRQSLEDAAKTAAMARTLDAPVRGGIITRSDRTVEPGPLLECPILTHVPIVAEPLADERVYDAYASIPKGVTKRNI